MIPVILGYGPRGGIFKRAVSVSMVDFSQSSQVLGVLCKFVVSKTNRSGLSAACGVRIPNLRGSRGITVVWLTLTRLRCAKLSKHLLRSRLKGCIVN